jgi:hypothetical protein
MAAGRNPHAAVPCAVAAWPDGPNWPTISRSLRKLAKRKLAENKEARRLRRD